MTDQATCFCCHESITADSRGRWTHDHTGEPECWTGDGQVAHPGDDSQGEKP